jgi:anhydro-N-acetylmuramic acid kinase
LLPGIEVKSTAEVGIDPDYLEAMMFAWLASQTLNRMPVDFSIITGSKGPEILGAIYQAYTLNHIDKPINYAF